MWYWDTQQCYGPHSWNLWAEGGHAGVCTHTHTHTHTHRGIHIQMASGLRSNLLGYFIFKAVIFLQTTTKENSGGESSAKKVLLLFWSHLLRSQLESKCDVVYFGGHMPAGMASNYLSPCKHWAHVLGESLFCYFFNLLFSSPERDHCLTSPRTYCFKWTNIGETLTAFLILPNIILWCHILYVQLLIFLLTTLFIAPSVSSSAHAIGSIE